MLKNLHLSFLMLIFGSIVPEPVSAQFIEKELWNGSDSNGNHFYVINPAAYPEIKKTQYDLIGAKKDNSVKIHTETLEGGKRDIDVDVEDRMLGAAGVLDLGGGSYAAGNFQYNTKSTKGSLSVSQVATVRETINHKYASLNIGFEIFDGFRVGGNFKAMEIDADIAGSYWSLPGENTSYTGVVTGDGFGVLLGNSRGGFGFAYIRPLRGKIKVQEESVIISENGVYLSEVHFSVNQTRIGFGGRFYPQQKGNGSEQWQDGRNETRENAAGDSYLLRGLYHEEPIFGYGLGVESMKSNQFYWQLGYVNHFTYLIVPSLGGDVGRTWINRNRVLFSVGKKDFKFSWELGAALSLADKKFTGSEGRATYESREQLIFIKGVF